MSKGIELIKKYEGFSSTAYLCPANVLTIGYGETSCVTKGQTMTEAEASLLLEKRYKQFEGGVKALLKTMVSDNQLAALVSFAYNLGVGALSKSTLLKRINAEDPKASDEFLKWNKAGGKVLKGLTLRRIEEKQLFDTV